MPDDLRDQFPKVREIVEALRIPIYELAGFEADDLIGTLVAAGRSDAGSRRRSSRATSTCSSSSASGPLMTTRGGVQQTVIYDRRASTSATG